MDKNLICCAGATAASRFAAAHLAALGLPVTYEPSEHVKYLLLDVPSFGPEGQLRMGGSLQTLLRELPGDVTVCGGNLSHPALGEYRTVDLLQDPEYLAQNAYITAECALDTALPYLPVTLRRCPVLILGWGRIGKCLGQILKALGAQVTIAARKESDRALIRALGYSAADHRQLASRLGDFRLLFNTVPAMVLPQEQMAHCRTDCVKIELASADGIQDADVILARGLPGIHMPESSGTLIAETFLHYYKEETE